MTVEELKLEIEKLSESDRAKIYYYLVDIEGGFDDSSDEEIQAAWDDECNRRIAEIKSGAVKLSSAKEVHDYARSTAAERLIARAKALTA
jgi:hypothetical protein